MSVVKSIFGCHAAMSRPRPRQPFVHGYDPTKSQHVYVCMTLGYPSVANEESSNLGYTTPDWWLKPSERSVTVSHHRLLSQEHRLLSTAICLDTVCRRTIYARETRAVFLAWSCLPKWWGLLADRRLIAWLSWSGYMLKLACRTWWGPVL